MIYKLSTSQQKELLSLRETGMGYQFIEARFYQEYINKQFVVLNAELLIENDRDETKNFRKIVAEGFSKVVRDASVKELKDIKLVSKSQYFNLAEESKPGQTKGAKDGPLLSPDGKSLYVRLSAYQDDKRIDKVNKKLLPGSYTTTSKDYAECVVKKDDPVERYALPNDDKIEWAFFIQTLVKDTYRYGIVQPDFGRRGGGEECLFENGTSFNTFKEETKYGEHL